MGKTLVPSTGWGGRVSGEWEKGRGLGLGGRRTPHWPMRLRSIIPAPRRVSEPWLSRGR